MRMASWYVLTSSLADAMDPSLATFRGHCKEIRTALTMSILDCSRYQSNERPYSSRQGTIIERKPTGASSDGCEV